MSKDSKAQHRANRQHPPTKIIVERHYAGTEKWKREYSIKRNGFLNQLSNRCLHQQ